MQDNHEKIYELLFNMNKVIGSMDTKIDGLVIESGSTTARVGILETTINYWRGKIAVASVVAGLTGTAILEYVKNRLKI